MAFNWLASASMIGVILMLAGYTYGPLLGLFAFGILTRRTVNDRWVPLMVPAGPLPRLPVAKTSGFPVKCCQELNFNKES